MLLIKNKTNCNQPAVEPDESLSEETLFFRFKGCLCGSGSRSFGTAEYWARKFHVSMYFSRINHCIRQKYAEIRYTATFIKKDTLELFTV